jgi:co-chaperonin GroES (HSP10)
MAVKVRPLHDRIIVERIEEGEQQVGGIIINRAKSLLLETAKLKMTEASPP